MEQRIYNHLQQALAGRQHLTETGVTIVQAAGQERFISYHELHRDAGRMLAVLQEKGLRKGDELILQTSNDDTFLFLFWAAILGGIVPVPLHYAATDDLKQKLVNVARLLRNPYVAVEESDRYGILDHLTAHPEGPVVAPGRTLRTEQLVPSDRTGEPAVIEASDLAFVQFSSGSTGQPKGVLLTHDNLCTNVYDIIDATRLETKDVFLTWMPLTHDMGLIGMHLTPLFLGGAVYNIPTTTFIRHPLLWVNQMHERRVTRTQSPNFGYSFVMSALKKDQVYDWDFSSVRTIFNGAEPISPYICREFLTTFAPYGLSPNVMFTVYGLAEATLAVSFPEPETEFKSHVFNRASLQPGLPAALAGETDEPLEVVSEGRPLQHVAVRICDGHDRVLPAGHVGHIQIKGRSVSRGYYGDSTFAHVSADGWLKTGDLGCFYAGELSVTGRTKELVIVNGQNFYPYDLEAKLCAVLDQALGKIVVSSVRTAQTERVLVFILFRKKPEDFVPLYEKALDVMTALTGATDVRVLPVSHIPKTTSGKIQRGKLAEQYLAGQFEPIESALLELIDATAPRWQTDDPEALHEQITAFLSAEMAALLPAYAPEDFHRPLMELGITSKQMILLTGRLSRSLGIGLHNNMYFQYPTGALLATHLAGLLGRKTEGEPQDELWNRISQLSDDEIAALLEADDFLNLETKR